MRFFTLVAICLAVTALAQTKPLPKPPTAAEIAQRWSKGATTHYCRSLAKLPKLFQDCIKDEDKTNASMSKLAESYCASTKDPKKLFSCVTNFLDDISTKRHMAFDQCGGYKARERNEKVFTQCMMHTESQPRKKF